MPSHEIIRRRYSPWRDIRFSALVGLLTAVLLIADVEHTGEKGCIDARYAAARAFGASSTELPCKLFLMTNNRLNKPASEDSSEFQKSLADDIDLIARQKPAVIGLYFDLRQTKLRQELRDCLVRHRDKVVAGYFGVGERTPSAHTELLKSRVNCGYTDLEVDPVSDSAYELALSYKVAAADKKDAPSLPSFARAVIAKYDPAGKLPWSHNIDRYPIFTKYWIDFLSDPPVQQIQISDAGTNLENNIVTIAPSTAETTMYSSPLGKLSGVDFQLRSISTLLASSMTADFSNVLTLLLLPIGAVLGAAYTFLKQKPLRRVWYMLTAFAVYIVLVQIVFQSFHILLPTMTPLLTMFCCYLACTVIFIEVEERDRRRELAMALQNRAEEERKRISKDIHDETLPELTRVKRIVNNIAEKLPDDPAPEKVTERLDSAILEMRRVVDDLHPVILDTLGLAPALENLLDKLTLDTRLETSFENAAGNLDIRFGDATKLSLYRIVQEALNNIEKHSGASKVKLAMRTENDILIISVSDNGRGFNAAEVNGNSHGLENIRQRAQAIGAYVKWKKPDCFESGTEVRVTILT